MIGPTRPWGPEVIRLIDEHVGGRLKERRLTFRIAQMEMARLLNVPKEVLKAYETGEVSIPAGDLYAVAKALEVGTGYFYEGLDQRFGTTVNVEAKPPKKRVYGTSP
jgi:transcriptional regulator with XRE-family HTH domain